jgi:hypothetical protein
MKLTTLSDGSILTTWDNDRGFLDAEIYIAHKGRVWTVADRGALVPAFGGLKMHYKEPLALAVRRGLNGERGTPSSIWPAVINVVFIAAAIAAAVWLIRH